MFVSQIGHTRSVVHLLLLIFLGGFLCLTPEANAQSGLNAHDLSGVRSEDISDDQLKAYIARGRAEGIAPEQAMNMARERGLPPSVANQLMQRMRNLDVASVDQQAGPGTRERHTPEDEMVRYVDEESEPIPDDESEIYGSRLFRRGMLSFEPSMNIPTPVNYQLGAGDELIIDIWGAATNFYQLEVSHEGTVVIDNLGPVFVNGLPIQQAEQRIMDKLKQLYRGLRPGDPDQNTFARISLGRVRSIQVTLMGEVNRPGNYTVSSLATVFNALYQAGGPNQIGSYRKIEVYRDNRRVSELDIYDFLLYGDQTNNIRLQDQDVIRVGPFENRVEVNGEVKRPGRYEVTEQETLDNLIRFAGYFTETAYTRQVSIERNTETERMILGVNRQDYSVFTMKNGDVVRIDRILDRFVNRVSISGAVWRPGEYELTEGMMLSDLLKKAEGVKPDAFKSRAIINRLTDDFDFTILAFNVDEVLQQPHRYDVPLRMEDEVIIKSIHEMREELTVSIRGAVQNGAVYQYREGMTLEDLILKAEGFRSSASEARIEINRRVIGEPAPQQRGTQMAETFIFGVDRNLALREDARTFQLQPFDQVFVRARPDYQAQVTIRIEGEVLYPGEYAISDRNERISDVIERAGGLTGEAYIDGATMIRQSRELERVEADLETGRDEYIEVERTTERFIGINLSRILNQPEGHDDLFVRPGDVIRVPSELQTVSVRGGVLRESEIRHRDGRSLSYYVNRSGGFAENARKRNVFVVHANGDVETRKNFLFFNSTPEITPGAEIVVPQREERPRMTSGERISVMSSVVSMAAIVVTALSRL